jgi:hypothetical protein
MGQQRRPCEVDPDPVDRLCRSRPRVFHVEDRDLHGRGATPAVFARPVDPDPSFRRELRLPSATPRNFLVDRVERRRKLDVRREPGANFLRERALVVGEAQVHYKSQKRSRW